MPWALRDKYINFTDDPVVQGYSPVVERTSLDDDDDDDDDNGDDDDNK